jgi:hypothetical protein
LLDLDSNPGCLIDSINNENITYGDSSVVKAGTYRVRIVYFSNCEVTEDTHYTVTVRFNGDIIASTTGSNPYSGVFNKDQSDWGVGGGVEVLQFNIASTSKKSSAVNEMYLTNYHRKAVALNHKHR